VVATVPVGNGPFEVAITPQSPSQLISTLITTVASFNLARGITNSLDAKLDAAEAILAAARANDIGTACNQIGAFINAVQAQSGKALTVAQANQLIATANDNCVSNVLC